MSDAKSYRITDELGTPIGSVTFDRAALLKALNAIDAPPPPPPGYTLYPGQDPAVAIADLNAGDNLWVVAGVHPHNIHLTKHINVISEPGATLSGWRILRWEHAESRVSSIVWRTPYNRFNGRLTHRIVTNSAFLAAQDGPARLAAHNAATRPELVAYNKEPLRNAIGREDFTPGSCWYDEKDGYLYACLPVGADLDLLEVATLPQLFTAADGVAGVTVEGLTLTGAANTHKQGALELHSDGNTIDVTVDTVNSLAFDVRGIGLFASLKSYRAGQGGYWIKAQKSAISIYQEGSNFRGSDAGWHTAKFEQSIDNEITVHSVDCACVGAWFDVGNHRNRVRVISDRASKNALMVEHYAEDNVFDLDITGTQSYGRWIGADVQIQSNAKRNTFTGRITGGAQYNVPLWLVYKTAEARGPSGPNVFRNITTGGRPMRIEGGVSDKDVFDNIS